MKINWNKTKIIATVGPACESDAVIRRMLRAGLDIARFNFSHGTVSAHVGRMRTLRALAKRMGCSVGILLDLPGPKIRIGPLEGEYIDLKKGQMFSFLARPVAGTSQRVSLPHRGFFSALRPQHVVYLNDGLVRLIVRRRHGEEILCEVTAGGRVFPRKGVSCPQLKLSLSGVTSHDLRCLAAGIAVGIDYVAISFVQDSRDVRRVKRFLRARGSAAMVIAKIERTIALKDLDRIVKESDAVMVARGDLGVEADLEQIPALQKDIIRATKAQAKPVITATQMMESMVRNPQPTRAEVTDIANAILDGTDAIMLSEETAVGAYPVACIEMMVRIAAATEKNFQRQVTVAQVFAAQRRTTAMIISAAAVEVAEHIKARVIAVPTNHAESVAWLSALKPGAVVFALTSDPVTFQKLLLFGGVFPLRVGRIQNLPAGLRQCARILLRHAWGRKGEALVVMLTSDNRLFHSNLIEIQSL